MRTRLRPSHLDSALLNRRTQGILLQKILAATQIGKQSGSEMPPERSLTHHSSEFRVALLSWYDAHARTLPWRSDPTLYKTVVSEFMLQQTQVKMALPYFDAWLRRFPDFAALASASETQALKSWEGLGYYTRARNLHRLAVQLAPVPKEKIPKDAESWLAFPGVGPYAAAAITSIAFNYPAAVVDGNVVRILARLTADTNAYKNASDAAKSYRGIAQGLLDPDRPGDHNQAMMELGATLCHKRSPNCLLCPVRDLCRGQSQGIAESLPRLAKTKFEEATVNRAWIAGPKGILLHRIPETARRMKGLHELPVAESLGLTVANAKPLLTKKRGITKYRITERIHAIPTSSLPVPLPSDHLWATLDQIEDLPFSGPHRRWITELLAGNPR